MTMANKRADKEKAEQSKKFLLDIVEGYCRVTEDEKKEGLNQGSLKFLKGTMVRAVVLSANPQKKRTAYTFRNYFEKMILPKEYDRLISYTDPERNLDAFLADPYFFEEEVTGAACMDGGQGRPLDVDFGRAEGELLPFLLLRDLQKHVELRLETYLKQKGPDFYGSGDESAAGTAAERQAVNAKEEKYLDFVYALQYYEIFMEAFRERLLDPALWAQEEEAFRALQECEGRWAECREKAERVRQGEQLLGRTRECMAVLRKKRMGVLYGVLYLYHYINLMALLRLLVIAEYVNIHHSYTGVRDEREKARRRRDVEQLVTKELRGLDLFFFHYRDNPNLAVLFRELAMTAEKRSLIPDPENPEEMGEFHDNLEAYVTQIREKKAGERDAAQERRLVKSQILLAEPLLCKLEKVNGQNKNIKEELLQN